MCEKRGQICVTDFALNFSARNYTTSLLIAGRCFLFVFNTAARHHSRGRVSSSAVPGELHPDARGPAPSRDIESLIAATGGTMSDEEVRRASAARAPSSLVHFKRVVGTPDPRPPLLALTAPSRPSPLDPQAYEDDYEDDFVEEDEYADDDFEDDEPPTPPAPLAPPRGVETDLQRAMREENERAARECGDGRLPASRLLPFPPSPSIARTRPLTSVTHALETLSPSAWSGSFPSSIGRAPETPARRVSLRPRRRSRRRADDAARARRWKMVVAAVGGMTHADAACGTDACFVAEPMTPARMFEIGVGPHARRSAASAQTGGDDDARDFETQTDVADQRAIATQCPEDLAVSRHQLEAEAEAAANAAGAATRALPAALTRRRAAAAALKWARATGHLQHSKDRRLAGFITRAGFVADVLLRERETAIVEDVMRFSPRRGGGVKPGVTSGARAASRPPTRRFVAAMTDGRVATSAAFAPGARGARKLAVAYAPRDAKARGSAGMGLILVWDLAGAEPEIVAALVAEGRRTRVAWGPGQSHALIFCGTEEGAVCAWDLRESDEAHRAAVGALADEDRVRDGIRDEDEDEDERAGNAAKATALRRPSYSTEGVFADVTNLDEENLGSIVSLGVAADAAESSSNDAEGGARGGRDARDFHLVVLKSTVGAAREPISSRR